MAATMRIHPPLLYSAAVIWPPLCTAVVGARFATRKAQGNRYGIDDWLVLPALVFIWGLSAAMIAGVALGAIGHPNPNTATENALMATTREQTIVRKIYFAFITISTFTLGLLKLSCLAFYRRIFHTGSKSTTNIVLLTFMSLITFWTIAMTFAYLFICRSHLEWRWTSVNDQRKCGDTSMVQKALFSSDVGTDTLLLLLPIPFVLQLHMNMLRKLAVLVIFFLGSLSLASSIIRLVILLQGLNGTFSKKTDQNFLSTAGCYFTLIEVGFGLCAICLPSLSGAFKLKGVQTFFANLSSTFSLSSHSREKNDTLYRKTTENSGKITAGSRSIIEAPGSDHIELEELPDEGVIHVRRSVELRKESV